MVAGLRQAQLTDLAAVESLVEAAYGGYAESIGARPGPLSDDYRALITAGQVTVVERGGVIVALLVLIALEDAMLLDNIAVAPQAQGLGLGRDLLAYADQAAMVAGLDRIRLYTHQKMVRNQAVYARAGYHETHRITEKGLRRVYMEKALP